MDCLLVSCHSAFPSFLMFSLESSPLDVSPAFIASSIIHKPFDRHMDGDVWGDRASQEASAALFELLPNCTHLTSHVGNLWQGYF